MAAGAAAAAAVLLSLTVSLVIICFSNGTGWQSCSIDTYVNYLDNVNVPLATTANIEQSSRRLYSVL